MAANTAARAQGVQVWRQVSCRPLVFQMNLREPFTFNMAPAFAQLMNAPIVYSTLLLWLLSEIYERMPEVGRRFYNNVIALTIARLAAYLEAHVGSGDLEIEDCQLAATQFMQMCQASLFMPFIFQAAPAPSAERIAQVVESATRMFLAGYTGRTPPDRAARSGR
jgi:hypothetical protein